MEQGHIALIPPLLLPSAVPVGLPPTLSRAGARGSLMGPRRALCCPWCRGCASAEGNVLLETPRRQPELPGPALMSHPAAHMWALSSQRASRPTATACSLAIGSNPAIIGRGEGPRNPIELTHIEQSRLMRIFQQGLGYVRGSGKGSLRENWFQSPGFQNKVLWLKGWILSVLTQHPVSSG